MDKNPTTVVFVVDDEEVIAMTLDIILKQNGFSAVSFTKPHEALEEARVRCPDVLISDVFMPGMNGVDLAIELSKICSNIKVLLFSGQAETSDLLAIARTHGHRFEILCKPVHPAVLLKAVRAFRKVIEIGEAK